MNFRLYNKKENRHIYDCEYFINKKGDVVYEYLDDNGSQFYPSTCEYEIQYSTGLDDTNGVEIFEGDAVIWHEAHQNETEEPREAKVVYSPKVAAFVLDIYGRHLFDDKYGDYQHLHYQTKYTIKK
jgi:hypothetical protein